MLLYRLGSGSRYGRTAIEQVILNFLPYLLIRRNVIGLGCIQIDTCLPA